MKTRKDVKDRYKSETGNEVNAEINGDFCYTDEYVEWLERLVVDKCYESGTANDKEIDCNVCDVCDGTGATRVAFDIEDCWHCDGTGE